MRRVYAVLFTCVCINTSDWLSIPIPGVAGTRSARNCRLYCCIL